MEHWYSRPSIFLKTPHSYLFHFHYSFPHTHTHTFDSTGIFYTKWRRLCWDLHYGGARFLPPPGRRRRIFRAAASHLDRRRNGRLPYWGPLEGSASRSLFWWSWILSCLGSPFTISPEPPVLPPTLATLTPDLRSRAFHLLIFSSNPGISILLSHFSFACNWDFLYVLVKNKIHLQHYFETRTWKSFRDIDYTWDFSVYRGF